ncbi:MAG TPA: multiheme c-type cytochrome [Bryobacterales bacterium]|nr:multiheme c-type cytochrome [Bryobacterales bacterium]
MWLLSLLLAAAGSPYAGAAACRQCHAAEFAAQSATAHAAALAHSKAPQPGGWAFGAGAQAITFVSRLDAENYLENGKSWYRSLQGYALTPGHRNTTGQRYRTFDPSAAILRCFACHSTGPLALGPDEAIIPHELGVRCEACHGPAADHARDPAHHHPRNPATLSADQLNALCGECHRMPAAATDSTDLRNPWNARHQPLLLAASRCFRESKGRLSCLTCHQPHAALERRLVVYDAACKSCHASPRHSRPILGRACAECHMPAVRPQPELAFANHRIAIYAPADPLSPVTLPVRARR